MISRSLTLVSRWHDRPRIRRRCEDRLRYSHQRADHRLCVHFALQPALRFFSERRTGGHWGGNQGFWCWRQAMRCWRCCARGIFLYYLLTYAALQPFAGHGLLYVFASFAAIPGFPSPIGVASHCPQIFFDAVDQPFLRPPAWSLLLRFPLRCYFGWPMVAIFLYYWYWFIEKFT